MISPCGLIPLSDPCPLVDLQRHSHDLGAAPGRVSFWRTGRPRTRSVSLQVFGAATRAEFVGFKKADQRCSLSEATLASTRSKLELANGRPAITLSAAGERTAGRPPAVVESARMGLAHFVFVLAMGLGLSPVTALAGDDGLNVFG